MSGSKGSKSSAEVQEIYAELASSMDRMAWLNPLVMGRHRRRLFGKARRRTLDVARESARVLKSTGCVSIFDKFIPSGERPSLLRRGVNPLARLIFADLNRSLEPILSGTSLHAVAREPFMAGIYSITIARTSSDA